MDIQVYSKSFQSSSEVELYGCTIHKVCQQYIIYNYKHQVAGTDFLLCKFALSQLCIIFTRVKNWNKSQSKEIFCIVISVPFHNSLSSRHCFSAEWLFFSSKCSFANVSTACLEQGLKTHIKLLVIICIWHNFSGFPQLKVPICKCVNGLFGTRFKLHTVNLLCVLNLVWNTV